MTFTDYLKNFFFLLLIIQFAPPLIQGISKQLRRYIEPRTQVAELKISGLIMSSTHYAKYLKKYFKNPKIKAILLRVESAGGTAGSGQSLFNEIQTLKKEFPKPVITLVENMCASTGYYIACASDSIITSGQATIGSIGGVFRFLFQFREFIEKYNIYYKSVKAGKFKSIGDPFVDMTPEDQALLQGVLDDSYQQFTEDVAQKRNLAIAEADTWANGRIFSGRQAHKIGLIDAIGSRSDAIKKIREMALIEGKIEWVRPPKKSAFAQLFGGGETDDTDMEFTSRLHTLMSKAASSFVIW